MDPENWTSNKVVLAWKWKGERDKTIREISRE